MCSLRAQASIEERRYDPLAGPPTARPPKPPPLAAADTPAADTLSDPLYEAVNTLKKVHSQYSFCNTITAQALTVE